MTSAVPERVRWAVETLGVEPGEHVLELGCGSGVAAALVCERLVEGHVLAIDRSPIEIERARRRNAPHLASGRLALEAVELVDLDVGKARFDKAFAINVNVFWLSPATRELAVVRRALAPGGRFFLFYEAPEPERAREVAQRLAAALHAAAFTEREVLVPTPALVGCVSRPSA